MNRRHFLQSLGVLFWHPWAAATTPQPIITDLGDGDFLIEVGCLHCSLCPDSSTGSLLDFMVYVTDRPIPGMIRERRMVPTKLLKKKLEEVGFPSVFDGYELSLVSHMPGFVTPNEVAEKLQQILRGGDWTLLYYDPDSGG